MPSLRPGRLRGKLRGRLPGRLRGRLQDWARAVKRDVLALWLGLRDPRVPLAAKLVAGVVVAYALSPVDLIPDFIPVLGLLDDAVLLPLGILLAVRLIPTPVMADLRASASGATRPTSLWGAAGVIAVWLVLAWLAWQWVVNRSP